MKVRSLQKSKNTFVRKAVLVLVVVLLIGYLVPIIFTTIGQTVMYPVYATQSWFRESTASLPIFLREKKELQNEIEKLESELALAQSSDYTQQRLQEESLLLISW